MILIRWYKVDRPRKSLFDLFPSTILYHFWKVKYKNTVKILNQPSADAVTQNVHKSDTTASNTP